LRDRHSLAWSLCGTRGALGCLSGATLNLVSRSFARLLAFHKIRWTSPRRSRSTSGVQGLGTGAPDAKGISVLNGIQARVSDFDVLRDAAAACAYATNHLAVDDDRNAAIYQ